MLLSAVSVLVVAQSSSEIPEGLMNNPVYIYTHTHTRARARTYIIDNVSTTIHIYIYPGYNNVPLTSLQY